MAPKRKSVALLRESGSRHYTKAELDRRETEEIKLSPVKKIKPPKYLPCGLADKFEILSATLVEIGILTELDADNLARYLIAEQNYLRATNRITAAMNVGDASETEKWTSVQDRFFKQCRMLGNDLGLTVSSRCNLVIPNRKEQEIPAEEVDLFGEA